MSTSFRKGLYVYGVRILVLYIFSIVFKSFDLSIQAESPLYSVHAFSLLFVVCGLLVWSGAVALAKFVHKTTIKRSAVTKMMLLVLWLLVYGLLAVYLFSLCYALFDITFFGNYVTWQSFASSRYNLIAGLFIFYVLLLAYNGAAFYYKSWQESILNEERLRRENIQAKYDVLRNQVDPHFFFNSLSVLTNLVYQSADLSAEYITQLAKSYRYILDKKFENLVTIKTELEFLESYFFLINIRHGESIQFEVNISDAVQCAGMLPPATLQMLVENAVKHNRFTAEKPLHISLTHRDDSLYIVNELRKRYGVKSAIGLGLENIAKRYELTCDRKIEIIETDDQFIVKIPIIKQNEGHHI
jgi:two-component system LytT family sensor kinase